MLISAEGFHINCSVAVPLHCQHTVLLLFPCLLIQGQDKGISMISGEKGLSFAAGCHFPLPNTQRRQPTGAQLLSLAADSLWLEQNYQMRKNTNFFFTLLTLPQSNVRGAIFFEERKLFLATGVWQKRQLKSAVSTDWYVFQTSKDLSFSFLSWTSAAHVLKRQWTLLSHEIAGMHQFKGIRNQAKLHSFGNTALKTKQQREHLAANISCQWELNLL